MRAALLMACAVALGGGCGGTAECRDGTLFVTVTLDAATGQADALEAEVALAGGAPMRAVLQHRPGEAQGGIQVDFPSGYPQGQTVTVTLVATLGGTALGRGGASTRLDGKCAALHVDVTATGAPDLAVREGGPDDLALPDAAVGDGPPGDGCVPRTCAAACGISDDGCGRMLSCPPCQLNAIHPAVAQAGDAITLEGSFNPGAVVVFPPGVSATPTLSGPGRLLVTVPATAGTGDLMVRSGGTDSNGQRFRRASFAVGLGRFQGSYEQTGHARQMPVLTRAGTVRIHTVGKHLLVFGPTVERALINADGTVGAFTDTGVAGGGAAAFSGRWAYAFGDGTPASPVRRAPIDADGTVGAFTAAAGVALPAAYTPEDAIVIGGYLYLIGGRDGLGASVRTVIRAPITAPDGTLGNFADAGVQLVRPRIGAGLAVVGRYLYVLGGYSPATEQGYERAVINPDGTLQAFSAAGLLSAKRGTAAVHRTAKDLYLIGGFDGTRILGTVDRAPIGGDDTLGSFAIAAGSTLVTPRANVQIASAVIGNHLYLVGGATSAADSTPTVERASINASGMLGPFQSAGVALVMGRDDPGVLAVGDSLYVLAGRAANNRSIELAPVAADGQLGAFTMAPMQLTNGRDSFPVAVTGDYVYLIAGGGGTDVERARINPDGTLGAFTLLLNVQNQGQGTPAVIVGSSIYLLGGVNGGLPRSEVRRATIAADGGIGPFSVIAGVALTRARYDGVPALLGGTLYLIGGADNTNAVLASIEQVGANPDGTLSGSFTLAPASLTAPRSSHVSTLAGSLLYVMAGEAAGGVPILTPEWSTVSGTGTLGAFTGSGSLPAGRLDGRMVQLGNYVYIIGGSGAAQVLRAELQ